MTTTRVCFAPPTRLRTLAGLAAALFLTTLGAPASAQYKVVGPDGKVTYTDRPPTAQEGQVSAIRRDGAPAGSGDALAPLPLELRQIAQRFPVVLYTAADCAPCDLARKMLHDRGVPLTERTVSATEADLVALERAVGDRSLPALTVGRQATSGYAQARWTELLTLAGYPEQIRLPSTYRAPAPTPLVPPPPPRKPAPELPSTPTPEPPPPPASGIRF